MSRPLRPRACTSERKVSENIDPIEAQGGDFAAEPLACKAVAIAS
jgi:hypothetical protein